MPLAESLRSKKHLPVIQNSKILKGHWWNHIRRMDKQWLTGQDASDMFHYYKKYYYMSVAFEFYRRIENSKSSDGIVQRHQSPDIRNITSEIRSRERQWLFKKFYRIVKSHNKNGQLTKSWDASEMFHYDQKHHAFGFYRRIDNSNSNAILVYN